MPSLRTFLRRAPAFLLPLADGIDRLNQGIGRLSLGLVVIMIGVGVWNVIGRFLGRALGINLTSNALIEAQWYLFDLIFLLGAAYVLRHNEHVRVDVLSNRWSRVRRAWVDLGGTLLFLIPFCLMVIVVSWQSVVRSWQIGELSPDPGGLPRYPIKTMILVSFALLILQGIAEIIKQWAFLTGQRVPPLDPPESEL
ncbi:TRAP transporter small permease subunit [Lyngbya confervoides]|uniref:TRAP transporter small permease subunit n=1 Tax=Lyngbya confervoides BDU141951 TaxID=1574623 RepID=A0ABD4T8F5_9CYAN|nr:TRAP transporter small permease subunit [Lyngbya confervoides]MCM1984565.1 TRAP transporter small permease subunit [Lyngbya confervoides BDU141951]